MKRKWVIIVDIFNPNHLRSLNFITIPYQHNWDYIEIPVIPLQSLKIYVVQWTAVSMAAARNASYFLIHLNAMTIIWLNRTIFFIFFSLCIFVYSFAVLFERLPTACTAVWTELQREFSSMSGNITGNKKSRTRASKYDGIFLLNQSFSDFSSLAFHVRQFTVRLVGSVWIIDFLSSTSMKACICAALAIVALTLWMLKMYFDCSAFSIPAKEWKLIKPSFCFVLCRL